ncbi:uncharacterized protein K452DRAFT_303559 [Aplosporella prunicola CBS 121167]|uniref:Uncharacterized protein n=1 Tax=Aplosporella prunicola CBS 121167 TaxID=1176127 RepID=A0A6A6AXY5_9PEZI|nr:uncharacterized protein K452DRAFT_303559 [Aplosporella prunicola CBS 121167]KAF2135421.1 hypothetical protein K452DRAFT_303559 [Aplosporella prunicola CBS 121167]
MPSFDSVYDNEAHKRATVITNILSKSTNIDLDVLVRIMAFANNCKFYFAVSQNGDFLSVPHEARLNDMVCILYGCDVSVLLRPENRGFYTFVGQCYVQGFMRGKTIEGLRDGRYKSEMFELR